MYFTKTARGDRTARCRARCSAASTLTSPPAPYSRNRTGSSPRSLAFLRLRSSEFADQTARSCASPLPQASRQSGRSNLSSRRLLRPRAFRLQNLITALANASGVATLPVRRTRLAMSEIGVFEAIYSARALRRFKPDPVPDEIITRVLDAA